MSRRVCTRADEALRDEYKLAGWVQKPTARRKFYFDWCARATVELSALNGGTDPMDESVVLLLIGALGEDRSFAGHVRRRRGSFLTENGNWDKLYRASAATILEEYHDAVENGMWP